MWGAPGATGEGSADSRTDTAGSGSLRRRLDWAGQGQHAHRGVTSLGHLPVHARSRGRPSPDHSTDGRAPADVEVRCCSRKGLAEGVGVKVGNGVIESKVRLTRRTKKSRLQVSPGTAGSQHATLVCGTHPRGVESSTGAWEA